jgi:hypothetical protein
MKRVFNKAARRTVAAAIGSVLATGIASASPIERTVDTTGLIGPVTLNYGDHTLNSGLSNPLEVDRYTFAVLAGDKIRIGLHTLTAGLDPSLVVRGPTGGTIVGSTSCNGTDGFGRPSLCSTSLDQTFTSAGLYTLNLSDLGADEAGSYQLHLDRYPPVNNWVGFKYATPVSEALGHSTDMDFFAFKGVANSGVRLTVATATGGLDPVLEVWDPQGIRISNTFCSGTDGFGRPALCTDTVDFDFSQTGTYKIGISESGLDETGNYRFEVSCLYGNCPSPLDLAPAVPEPSSFALTLAGLALLAQLARRRP